MTKKVQDDKSDLTISQKFVRFKIVGGGKKLGGEKEMEFEVASEIVKGKKRIIGLDLTPKKGSHIGVDAINTVDEEEFCRNLFYRYNYFTIDEEEKKIIIESSKHGSNWNKCFFGVSKKEAEALRNILRNKRSYTIEITENSIIKLRINEDGKMNRYPGNKHQRKIRNKLKRTKKK